MQARKSTRLFRGQVAIEKPSVSASYLKEHVAIKQSCEPASRNLHGQVATEFFLYTAVFMIVAIAAFVVIDQTQRAEIPLRENMIAQETGRFFQSSIEMSIRAGEGFTYNYTFPRTVLGYPYNLTFSKQNNFMVLDWKGSYGVYSQAFDLPVYSYAFAGIKPDSDPYVFESTSGGSSLTLYNDGKKLIITHGDS